MTQNDQIATADLRARIEAELEELTELRSAHSADSAPVSLDQQSVGRVSRMDAMQRQAMAVASERRRKARIEALKGALRRIELGDYGFCANCGEPIALGRLNADPTAVFCVSCARSAGR